MLSKRAQSNSRMYVSMLCLDSLIKKSPFLNSRCQACLQYISKTSSGQNFQLCLVRLQRITNWSLPRIWKCLENCQISPSSCCRNNQIMEFSKLESRQKGIWKRLRVSHKTCWALKDYVRRIQSLTICWSKGWKETKDLRDNSSLVSSIITSNIDYDVMYIWSR